MLTFYKSIQSYEVALTDKSLKSLSRYFGSIKHAIRFNRSNSGIKKIQNIQK